VHIIIIIITVETCFSVELILGILTVL